MNCQNVSLTKHFKTGVIHQKVLSLGKHFTGLCVSELNGSSDDCPSKTNRVQMRPQAVPQTTKAWKEESYSRPQGRTPRTQRPNRHSQWDPDDDEGANCQWDPTLAIVDHDTGAAKAIRRSSPRAQTGIRTSGWTVV